MFKEKAQSMTTVQEYCLTPRISNIPKALASPLSMDRVGCIILGGGQGTRLFPLTVTRCKPAICFGGRYCLIDVPVSNALNSNCNKIFIVTQFLSSSLHRHVFQTYRRDAFSNGFIEVLAAEQKPTKSVWFQGPADAVRQNLEYFKETAVDYFLILSGDQLYHLNFQHMLQFARKTDADLVIATLPIGATDAKRMGIAQIDAECRIRRFHEKPQTLEELEPLRADDSVFTQHGLLPDPTRPYLGSMGIYLFKRETLFRLLEEDQREDFGKHLIPTQVQRGGTYSFVFDGYWEDIGTIESFYNANMALTQQDPLFDCNDEQRPIYCHRDNLPAAKIMNARIEQSLICEGAQVEANEIIRSILGPRSKVLGGTIIEDSYVMGHDFYKPRVHENEGIAKEFIIGERCVLRRTIVDKNVRIGNGVRLTNERGLTHYDGNNIYIRDGIIVVTRGAVLPDGFVL